MNRQRSVTAERVFSRDPRLEVRSAGVREDAERRISADDLKWADIVFVMEREHQVSIRSRFPTLKLPRIDVLDIPDEYLCMDPELQTILRSLVGPEIDALLAPERRR